MVSLHFDNQALLTSGRWLAAAPETVRGLCAMSDTPATTLFSIRLTSPHLLREPPNKRQAMAFLMSVLP